MVEKEIKENGKEENNSRMRIESMELEERKSRRREDWRFRKNAKVHLAVTWSSERRLWLVKSSFHAS
jgi:hypothetical protein